MKQFTLNFFLAVFAVFVMVHMPALAGETINIMNLRCEYRTNPLGIDVVKPRLSWILGSDARGQKQTAYQVLVAASMDKLTQDNGDLWDSGKVNSDHTIH